MRKMMVGAMYLRKMLIPMWYKLEKSKISAEEELKQIRQNLAKLSNNPDSFQKSMSTLEFNRMELPHLDKLINSLKSITTMTGLLKTCKELYFKLQEYKFDIEKRSELFDIFKDLFQEVILSLNMMKANELIRYVNYEILKNNDNLFEYLKKRVVKYEFKEKKITNANVDEIVDRCIAMLQSDKTINYKALVIEQLKQFYNLQANQVTIWNEEGGDQLFRNDSEKFSETDDEYIMHSELFSIEDKFKDKDSQFQQSEGPFIDSLDHEIIPKPNKNYKYNNNKERLKLDIMDLESSSDMSSSELNDMNLRKQNQAKVMNSKKDIQASFLLHYSNGYDQLDNYKRFFRKDDFDEEIEDIFDKSLYEFPVFGLNETYIKSIGIVFSIKVKQIYNIKRQTLDLIDNNIEQYNTKEQRIK